MSIKEYIQENENRFLEELFSLIRIPSISALPEHKDDMWACAERWKTLLLEAGVDEARVMPSAGNPMVYAEKKVGEGLPTVLVYAHYDVMPAEPLELWKSNPFEPEIRDGRIWARGADDDKGQAMIQVKAFEYLVRHGLLRHNMKFIFEGEEEIGSPSLNQFLQEHKELLQADVIWCRIPVCCARTCLRSLPVFADWLIGKWKLPDPTAICTPDTLAVRWPTR